MLELTDAGPGAPALPSGDGDHLYAWIEGAPYTGSKPHRTVPLAFLHAQDATERVGDPAIATAIRAAAWSYRSLGEHAFYADNRRTLEGLPARDDTPGRGIRAGEWSGRGCRRRPSR